MLPDFFSLIRNPIHFLALGLGSGLSPKAPGTAGTVMAIPLFFLFANTHWLIQGGIILVTFFIGIYLCHKTAEDFGVHDHPAIVWDEFVGYWLTLWPLALLEISVTWQAILLSFLLFRLFDILKPWPIKLIDKQVEGGFGIMLDDMLAGVYAGIGLILILPIIS